MGESLYRITHIETQKHRKNRINIYLDGAFAFGVDREVLLRHPLHEGDEIQESTVETIRLAEEKIGAKKKALRLLSHRAQSVWELKKKLREKNYSEKTIGQIIEDFTGVGLLDDAKFASNYVHSRMIQRPVGKRLLKHELLSKGIHEEQAQKAVNAGYGDRTEVEVARNLIQKRITQYRKEDPKLKKKLSDFLFRRGFDWDVIVAVFEEDIWKTEN